VPPEIPNGFEYLISHFALINRARGSGFNGPLAISFTELKAFSELLDITLEPWEVRALLRLDAAYIEASMDRGA
jgi:hypothetical protein